MYFIVWENVGGANITKKDYLQQFTQSALEKMIREFELEDRLPVGTINQAVWMYSQKKKQLHSQELMHF